jgi:hypothetical protein
MKTVREHGTSPDRPGSRRSAPEPRGRTPGIALLFAVFALGFSLWIPAFHHHDTGEASANCTVCLTVGAQSCDLPTAAASFELPPPVEGGPLLDPAPLGLAAGACQSESPRGPPLT